MAISPIGFPPPVAPTTPTAPVTSARQATAADAPDAAQRAQGFGRLVADGLQQVQDLQSTSDAAARRAATGDLTDVHDFMIASAQANVATSLTVAVRNRAVESFNEIMRMPV